MRDISSLNIDYSNKWDLKPNFQAKQIVIARALLKNQKRGVDITKFENVKNERIFTVPIKFSDYCDVICNYEEICKDVARLDSIVRKRKYLDPINGAVYKIPTIFLIIRRINNSDNKYQTFYDELFMNYFRNYVELILFEYKSPISVNDIKEYDVSKKVMYFRRPYDFAEILYSPYLTKEQKIKTISDHYNSCKVVAHSSEMIKNMISRENLIDIDLETQKAILNKWYSYNRKSNTKTISILKKYII